MTEPTKEEKRIMKEASAIYIKYLNLNGQVVAPQFGTLVKKPARKGNVKNGFGRGTSVPPVFKERAVLKPCLSFKKAINQVWK
jgi:hypothetical protein